MIIPDDLEKKFRIKAVNMFGGKKGSLTEAINSAITSWVEEAE